MGMVFTDEMVEKNLKPGEKRIKTEFIFFPMTIKGVTKSFKTVSYMEIRVHKTFYRPLDERTIDKVIWEKFKWL